MAPTSNLLGTLPEESAPHWLHTVFGDGDGDHRKGGCSAPSGYLAGASRASCTPRVKAPSTPRAPCNAATPRGIRTGRLRTSGPGSPAVIRWASTTARGEGGRVSEIWQEDGVDERRQATSYWACPEDQAIGPEHESTRSTFSTLTTPRRRSSGPGATALSSHARQQQQVSIISDACLSTTSSRHEASISRPTSFVVPSDIADLPPSQKVSSAVGPLSDLRDGLRARFWQVFQIANPCSDPCQKSRQSAGEFVIGDEPACTYSNSLSPSEVDEMPEIFGMLERSPLPRSSPLFLDGKEFQRVLDNSCKASGKIAEDVGGLSQAPRHAPGKTGDTDVPPLSFEQASRMGGA